ncbi:MAG TPA: hypothetical protein VFQ35_20165, partial [Polyangiaceae bacterium]|nr:hypothetical protein [Polyangiaceae bacterium]
KEPKPPSVAGAGKKYPVPTTLDRVLAQAFKKMAALRTASVGALADQVGQAYGLTGDHRAWAVTREADLAKQIEEKLPALLAAPVEAPKKTVADDFFGESAALGEGLDVPGSAAPVVSSVAQTWSSDNDADAIQIPTKPALPLLLLVGGGALVLGVLVVVVLVLIR